MPAGKLYQVLRLRKEKGWLAKLSPRALRVDDALLDHYNWLRGEAYPSYNTLQHETGLSRASVSEALRELAFYRRWVISRETVTIGGKVRRINVYRLPPELVPDPPPARYVPSSRFTRKKRLPALRSERVDSSVPYTTETAEQGGRQSRASHPRSSRASHNQQFSALDGNNVVNNEGEQRSIRQSLFHSPRTSTAPNDNAVPEAVKRLPPANQPLADPRNSQELIRRHRELLRDGGNHAGVARGLAACLRCSPDEAQDLLTCPPALSAGQEVQSQQVAQLENSGGGGD